MSVDQRTQQCILAAVAAGPAAASAYPQGVGRRTEQGLGGCYMLFRLNATWNAFMPVVGRLNAWQDALGRWSGCVVSRASNRAIGKRLGVPCNELDMKLGENNDYLSMFL